MKKWYQSCGWMLAAALAFELSGCAKGSAYLSRITGRQVDDQSRHAVGIVYYFAAKRELGATLDAKSEESTV